MPMTLKKRIFQNSEPAYRAFLNKFEEKKKFNDACIILALEHAYSKTFKCEMRSDRRTHLVKIIYECKDKILRDLETLKNSPDSEIGPLKHLHQKSNDEIGKTTNKRKLNNTDVSKEQTTALSESKEKYSKRRSSRKRSLTKNKILQNDQKNQYSEITNKILRVTIENDKNLQDMASNCANKSKDNENQSSESNIKENDSNQYLRESNQEENENQEVTQEHNKSVEFEQSIPRPDGNGKSYTIEAVSVKKEIDLMDNSFQRDNLIPLPEQDTCPPAEITSSLETNASSLETNASSLETNDQSNVSNMPLVSVNSQENVSSLNIACYNNFVPPVQSFNSFNQMPQIQMPQMNYCPCMYMHHNMMMHSHYGCYHGTYHYPMINSFLPHAHHAAPFQHGLQQLQANQMTENISTIELLHLHNSMPPVVGNQLVRNNPPLTLNALQPFQQQLSNQIMERNSSPQVSVLDTAQELSKLQTAISNITSQLTSLQNAVNQSKSK